MRRADRLFRIIQELRSDRWLTAGSLAERLEVSTRTVYRDIQDLTLSGIPIIAEAGLGYRLMEGFRLPPLMFDEEELEALLLGVRMVEVWSDPLLAAAAARAVARIEAVLPERLLPELARNALLVPPFGPEAAVADALHLLRQAVRARRKVSFHYRRADGERSVRTVWPLGLAYWGRTWTLVAWCELRDEFRHFRLDRMERLMEGGEGFELTTGRRLEDFLARYPDEH
ncbi:helix-turn-helix transcriptional regulator [Endothiovibrio diazotrophicus]